jgi:hypothetical protein
MIDFYEIICSIDEFLNSQNKEKVGSRFTIDRFGNIAISIHEIFSDYIDGNYFEICELYYCSGKWVIDWEKHNCKIGDYINYVVDRMNDSNKNENILYCKDDSYNWL